MALMTTTTTTDYGPVLKQYNLKLDYLEDYGRVKRVYTDLGTFALKALPAKSDSQFINRMEELYKNGFTRIVPIYKTVDGRHFAQGNQELYYLMPWLKNEPSSERDERHYQLFRELARLHSVTVYQQKYNEEDVTAHYKALCDEWDNRNKQLESYIEQCERQWYMSPFELQFAMYFNEMMQACRFARSRLDEWYEKISEDKKYRTVLTHGKVSIKHFLFDEKEHGYFSSFERAKVATPINDLVTFYHRSLRTYPVECKDCYEWLEVYREHFPLEDHELQLLLSYLTYPQAMFRCVNDYQYNSQGKSELTHTKQLTKAYWLNKNIEYFASQIMYGEQVKKEQQQQQEYES